MRLLIMTLCIGMLGCEGVATVDGEEHVVSVTEDTPETPVMPESGALGGDPALVAFFGADEGSGGVLGDRVNSHNAALSGSVSWAAGQFGGALVFDGATTRGSVPDDDALDNAAFTVTMWVYPETDGTDQVLIAKYTDSTDGFQVWMDPLRHIRVATGTGANSSHISTGVLSLNTWNFVAVAYEDGAKEIHIGALDSTHTSTNGVVVGNSAPLEIGHRGNSFHFDGRMDCIRLYSVALSSTEVQGDYNSCE